VPAGVRLYYRDQQPTAGDGRSQHDPHERLRHQQYRHGERHHHALCTGKGGVTCISISPANVTVVPGGDPSVTVTWHAGACCPFNAGAILKDAHGGGTGTRKVTVQ
jgi:hypothetical protein